ncbi:hypothetical protein BH10ACT10_BH10ACT10_25560 [soil metagenome]
MRLLGKLTSVVLLAVGVVAAVTGAKSVEDVKRYLRMREM